LGKLQQQLQKHLESIFPQDPSSKQNTSTSQNISTPSQSAPPPHTPPQNPPQSNLPPPQSDTQFTDEDKKEIAQLTDTLPQPVGK
jgi:hypothetical protein